MQIPLQSEVTINRPGWVSNGAYGKVVGYRHDPSVRGGGIYIVYVPMMRMTLNLSLSCLCPLDPPEVRWRLVESKVTVSWQSLAQWTHKLCVPRDRRHLLRFLLS